MKKKEEEKGGKEKGNQSNYWREPLIEDTRLGGSGPAGQERRALVHPLPSKRAVQRTGPCAPATGWEESLRTSSNPCDLRCVDDTIVPRTLTTPLVLARAGGARRRRPW